MTKDQQNDFHLYGCMSKALRKLAEIRGQTIVLDEFCRRFHRFFLIGHYGALST